MLVYFLMANLSYALVKNGVFFKAFIILCFSGRLASGMTKPAQITHF